MSGDIFNDVCNMLKREGVKIYSGPKLNQLLTFGPPAAKSLKHEYGALECCIEIVKDLDDAVNHIHTYGSGHTEVIVTENGTIFITCMWMCVCVFVNILIIIYLFSCCSKIINGWTASLISASKIEN